MDLEDGGATGTRAREPDAQVRSPLRKKQDTKLDAHVDDNVEPRPDLSSHDQEYEDQSPAVDNDVGETTGTRDDERHCIRELRRERARQMHDSSSSSSEEESSLEN